jgi:uncharacterized protein (TIGR03437 family)
MRTAWGAATLISAVVFWACPAMAQGTLQLVPTDPVVSFNNSGGGATVATTQGSATITIHDTNSPGNPVVSTGSIGVTAPISVDFKYPLTNNLYSLTNGAYFHVTFSFTGLYQAVIDVSNDPNITTAGGGNCSKVANYPGSFDCGLFYMYGTPDYAAISVALTYEPHYLDSARLVRLQFRWTTGPVSTLAIDHAEVLQSIQSADGKGVRYIANKNTLVRAFAKTDTGSLFLAQNSYDPGLQQQGFATPNVGDRGDAGSSSNHVIYPNIPGPDDVSYSVSTYSDYSGYYSGVHTPQTVSGSVKINFQEQKSLPSFYVAHIGICFDPGTGTLDCPNQRNMAEQETGNSLFPFPDHTFQYVQIPLPDLVFPITSKGAPLSYPKLDFTLSRLLYKYFIVQKMFSNLSKTYLSGIDHLVGWIPDYESKAADGTSQTLRYEDFAQAYGGPRQISWQPVLPDYVYDSELPHRLGHQFGLADEAPGPIGDVGFDGERNKVMPPGSPKLMDPTFGASKWITVDEYNQILARYPLTSTPPTQPRAAAVSGEYAVITGVVQRDGSGAQIDPVFHLNGTVAADPSNPAGNHCLQFANATTVLGQYCFDLDVTPAAGLDQQMFAVIAPWPAGTTQLTLLRGAGALQTLKAAAVDPAVTIVAPKPGDRWQGVNTVSWSVTGAASSVVSSLLYSPDGGTSWLPLATDLTDTQYSFDTSKILGGPQVFFRVIAASGLNSGTATMGPLAVLQTPKISAAVASLDFGNTVAGDMLLQRFTISSSGTGPLTVTSISSDNPAFTIASGASASPLMSGGVATVAVTFTASSAAGNQKATLTINSNDPLTPSLSIPLTAAIYATAQPSLSASPTAIDFGTVPVGQTGEAILPIANRGSTELDIASIASSSSQFTVASPATPLVIQQVASQDGILRFTPSATGLQTANVTLASNDPTHPSTIVKLQGTAAPASSTSPQIKSGGVVNAASFQGALVRGGLAALFGSNFTTGGATAQATVLPLPFSLLGVSITVGGVPAPLIYLNSGQINFQVPVEVPAGALTPVVVTVNGVSSPAVIAKMADYALGVFMYARTATAIDPIIVHGATNQLVTPSDPALPNETVVAYATGVGKLSFLPVTGAGSPSSPFSQAIDTPTAALGGQPAVVGFAGLTPALVGLIQLNIQLPAQIAAPGSGGSLPLTIQFPGDALVTVNLAVKGNVTAAPKLGLSSTSLAFGGVTVGQTKDLTVQVSNTGTAALSGTASVSGSGFTLVSGNPIQVAAGGTPQTITVRYAPTGATNAAGTLTISSNDPASPAAVALSGNGVAAAAATIKITPTTLDFGSVNANQTKDLTLTVSNNGSAQLTVNSVTSSNARFAMVSPGAPFNVGQESFQTVTIRFSPTTGGAQSGNLTFTSNDPSSPTIIPVTGTGVAAAAPAISITPATLDFGSVNANQTKDIVLQVNNNGSAQLTVSAFASSNARFTMLNPGAPFNVGQGSFQYVTIRFSPTTGGAQSGNLTFTSNAPASPTIVPVTGTGVAAAAPAISITPATLDFGTVAANQTKDLVLQVNNNGSAPLTVSASASSNARFTMLNPGVPFNVGQGSFQYVTIRFSPTATTAQTGTLTFTSNDPTSPTTIAVSGNTSGGTGGGCVAAPANQLTWITGDGNANDSAGSNNGTVVGGTTFVTGEVGQAFQFNGSTGYVSLGNPANLQLTSGITLEAWVNPVTAPATGALTAIVTKWGQVATTASNADAYGLWLELVSGHVAVFAAVNTAAGEPHIDGGVIPLNTWSHVAMTFNAASGALVVYVNGTAVGNTTFPGAILATTRNVLIGREDSFLPRAFNGGIDEVGIYGRALTAVEIQSIATAGAKGKCK